MAGSVLIIVQNLPVPLDRRVWLECQELRRRGYEVTVICPKGPGDPTFEVIEGVRIYKYRPAPEAAGPVGFAWEFAYSWARTAWLSIRAWRRDRFDVIQACNPPDTYWLLARLWRIRGVRFVFDQHDLNPELFRSRFGEPSGAGKVQFNGLLWLERRTYRAADRVVSTNESYRRKAIERGKVPPEHVTVVRSGPDTSVMRPIYPPPEIRSRARHLLVYLGIMGPQDNVDVVLDVMDDLVHRRGRTDVRAALLGFGDTLEDLKRRCTELGLDDHVVFTGRADKLMVADYLSAADVGLSPDRKTPLNDVSTMNKTMEYMAYGLPSVAFDLVETRVSGGDTVLYVGPEDVAGFADAVERLLDDPDLRVRMGRAARVRVSAELDWRPQAKRYGDVFDGLTGHTTAVGPDDAAARPGGGSAPGGRDYVDLADEAEFRRFLAERTAPAAN